MKKIYLCGSGHCPSVEVHDNKVLIGEDKNIVVLTKAQWNSLVEKTRTGDLDKI
jgi:hypothetical protein